MQLMLMMLACRGCPEKKKNSAADAHDTGLSGVSGRKNAILLMLMMMACQDTADAHDEAQCS